MLLLEMKDGRLQYGQPISFKVAGRDSFELVSEPQALFTLILGGVPENPGFGLRRCRHDRIDVVKLVDLAAGGGG
ncbi:MAG: hypothetical protein MZW92_61475 [Comamonadaceae bacterium]|nr:hypothetical protein [Comamonadaceae bacterium]